MKGWPTQTDFDESAIATLLEALAPVMPILERLVEVWRQRGGESIAHEVAACNVSCGQQPPADLRESDAPRLHRVHQGRGRRENLTGFYEDTLREVKDRRRLDVFAGYEACQEIFTPEQWETICFYWKEGLRQAEIAERLNLKHSAVSGRLTRAAARKKAHGQQMRQEQLRYLRKMHEE
jgi:predicted DNA-binding protein YlxM (UPF0122 family)